MQNPPKAILFCETLWTPCWHSPFDCHTLQVPFAYLNVFSIHEREIKYKYPFITNCIWQQFLIRPYIPILLNAIIFMHCWICQFHYAACLVPKASVIPKNSTSLQEGHRPLITTHISISPLPPSHPRWTHNLYQPDLAMHWFWFWLHLSEWLRQGLAHDWRQLCRRFPPQLWLQATQRGSVR